MADFGGSTQNAPGTETGKEKQLSGRLGPHLEVRTVREFGSTTWPMLTSTNYGKWAVHMKWKLCARRWWAVVETRGAREDSEVGAMEALMASTLFEFDVVISVKNSAKDAWDLLASFRIGLERVKKAKAQQMRREFGDMKFRHGFMSNDYHVFEHTCLPMERVSVDLCSIPCFSDPCELHGLNLIST